MNACLRDCRRSGSSLIEMLFVISLSVVVMAGVTILITGMWRAQRVMADHRTTMNSISQFAQQFRDDAHLAQNAILTKIGAAQALQLPQNGKSVEYRLENSSVERTVKKADAIVQRESYRLPAESLVEFEITPFEAGRLASVAIKSPAIYGTDADVAGRREFRVEAAIAATNMKPATAEGDTK
jgi:type II secretory pathway pseudopilin PulG